MITVPRSAAPPPPSAAVGPDRVRPVATRLVRAYHGSLAVLIAATLVAQCALTRSEGRSLVNTFSYFTIQSNVLVLLTSAILAVRPTVDGRVWRVVRLGALTGITVTGLVYATVLAPYVHLSGAALDYTHVFHYIVPAASIVGFVLIGPRCRFRAGDMAFMAWPVLWLVYTMVRGALAHPGFTGFGTAPSHYPYEFLDVDRVPLGEVVGAIAVVTLLLIGIGAAYIGVARRLVARRAPTVQGEVGPPPTR